MNPRSLWLGRSFGVIATVSLVAACSGATFKGKEGQQELETGGSGTTAGSGSGGSEGPGGSSKGGRPPTRGGSGGAGGNGGAEIVEPPIEGGAAPDVGGSGGTAGNDVGGSGGTAGNDVGGTGGTSVVIVVGGAGSGGGGTDPEPCASPVHDAWTKQLGAGGSGNWKAGFGDPHVDLATNELIVSYDDVAVRYEEFVGGYTVTAEVKMTGYTALTPYPNVWEVLVPSLRRSLDGSGIELGATAYGSYEKWRPDLFPGYGGVTLQGTTTVRVTTYVQAGSGQFALKVEAGGKAIRSGWLGDFTWPDTNLQIFRFVGQNNSAGGGDSDLLRVGPVDGCQKLSDAEVLKRYSE